MYPNCNFLWNLFFVVFFHIFLFWYHSLSSKSLFHVVFYYCFLKVFIDSLWFPYHTLQSIYQHIPLYLPFTLATSPTNENKHTHPHHHYHHHQTNKQNPKANPKPSAGSAKASTFRALHVLGSSAASPLSRGPVSLLRARTCASELKQWLGVNQESRATTVYLSHFLTQTPFSWEY